MSVDVRRGARLEAGGPKALFQTPLRMPQPRLAHIAVQYCVTGDGKKFIFDGPVEESSKPITVVLNWTAGLKR